MNRRTFLGGLGVVGGSLFIGKTETVQSSPEPEVEKSRLQLDFNEYGDIIIPGFFTVFVDGQEAYRMRVGDKVTADRQCKIVAFLGFELKPTHTWYLNDGDTLEVL